MYITIITAKSKVKRKILNFQIAGEEIHVNYKIGNTKIEKMTGTIVSTTSKAVVQSDIVKLRSSKSVTIAKDSKVIYSYEKIEEVK